MLTGKKTKTLKNLIFENGHFINPSQEGIALIVEDVREFVREGSSGQPGSADMKVVKLG